MLKKAYEWEIIRSMPVVKLVEEHGREELIEPWMEAKLLAVTEIGRTPTSKHAPKSINYGWQSLRDILMIMLDTGMRPAEVFRMRWEHVKWERELIFVPRSKSRKSKRFVGITQRVRADCGRAKPMRTRVGYFLPLVPNRVIWKRCRSNSNGPNDWPVCLNQSCCTVLGIASRPMRWRAREI